MDRKRCELSKVAKQYDLDITFANIEAQGEVKGVTVGGPKESTGAANVKDATTVIGNSVTVRDKGGVAGHFESGSDQLTPKAKEYFLAIATQYAPGTVAGTQLDPKQKKETLNQLAKRRILLVGHTDDTGSTQVNASLSERRARAVAAFLKQKGIPEESIFYQGAGESLPVADNRTEEGRATNRRVEIVELADEAGFKKYLEARKPQYAFYRSQPGVTRSSPEPVVLAAAPTISKTKKSNVGTSAPDYVPSRQSVVKSSVPVATQVAALPTVKTKPIIDFGGVPYTSIIAKIDTGAMLQEGGFNLISKAQADDSVLVTDCSYDRPRAVGAVKSLRDGSSYKTSEHLPQLYGKTWATNINGNLVVLNHVAVLRDGGAPANFHGSGEQHPRS
jgi:outer membrane protein OmpA-like peptidoglycan-associated protein